MGGRFPTSLAEITLEWLNQVLSANSLLGEDQIIVSFDAQPIALGFGQTGDSGRVALSYSGGESEAPQSVFVKFATSDAARRRASRRMTLYSREVYFYTELFKRVKVRAPRCYFAELSDDGEFFALVLEDFPNHRPGDETVGLSVHEAELAIDLMAELHGPYWDRMGDVKVAPLKMPGKERFTPAWDEMETRFRDLMPEQLRIHREPYLDSIPALEEWLAARPCTLGHGDMRLDNLLFGREEADPIVAVDWQAIRPRKGIRDLEYLICHSMDVELRRAHEDALLQRYVNNIRRFGISYSLTEAKKDYRRSMLFDFCTVIYIVGININTHERALNRKANLMRRATAAMCDWDVFSLLPEFS